MTDRKQGLFKDIKIVEFTNFGVGPRTGVYFAHYGAEVVKVESSVRPDGMRGLPPFKGAVGVNTSMDFTKNNPNKYGMTLNLKHTKGLELAKQLVGSWSNVVIENFTPGTLKRLGLGYENLKSVKPDLIMLSTCMQGQTGPACKHPGFGYHLSSLTGFNAITGWPDRDPTGVFGAYTDLIAPLFCITALLAAIDYRRITGKGQYLDVSQYETGVQFLAPSILDYAVNQRLLQPMANFSDFACPHGVYPCLGDDRWVAIAVTTDEEWQNFCKVIGSPEWTKEDRFATLSSRIKNCDEIDRLVGKWTADYHPEVVMTLMQENGIPASLVASNKDNWEDPQLKHEGRFFEVSHPETGTCFAEHTCVKLSKVAPSEVRHAPLLGEHTELVCRNMLGMSDEEFVDLLADGVLE